MRRWLLCLVMVLMATPAYAVNIRNLSGREQVVVLEQGGSRTEVTIPAGRTIYYTGTDMLVYLPNQEPVDAKFDEEYAIWPSGRMMIQRQIKNRGNGQ